MYVVGFRMYVDLAFRVYVGLSVHGGFKHGGLRIFRV